MSDESKVLVVEGDKSIQDAARLSGTYLVENGVIKTSADLHNFSYLLIEEKVKEGDTGAAELFKINQWMRRLGSERDGEHIEIFELGFSRSRSCSMPRHTEKLKQAKTVSEETIFAESLLENGQAIEPVLSDEKPHYQLPFGSAKEAVANYYRVTPCQVTITITA